MRKLNERANASGSGPTPSATPTPKGSPEKAGPTPLPTASSSNIVTIDPGAKARAAAAGSGGQVEPDLDADGNAITSQTAKYRIKLEPGLSPWITIITELIPLLSDPGWQPRHGAALGLLEIIRSLPSFGDEILLPIARHLLTLLALDRFGDFLGDTVVAPVRETSAQGLGICLKHLSVEGVKEVHQVLIAMIQQEWALRGKKADSKEKWEKFSWEVRHAGLLGLKYEVAVRGDLLGGVKGGTNDLGPESHDGTVKEEASDEDVDIKPDVVNGGIDIMADVVDATILA